MAGVLFEDIFDVKDIDPEGKKFDRGKSFAFKKYGKLFHFVNKISKRIYLIYKSHVFSNITVDYPVLYFPSCDLICCSLIRTDDTYVINIFCYKINI